jgi:hypothetical protein
MLSFFLGIAAGITVLLNGPAVRLGVARTTLKGGDALMGATREARRLSAKLIEDFEDSFAEAKQERAYKASQQKNVSDLMAELRALREDVASLEAKQRSQIQ